ncbi:MAG: hypothetical protein ACR2GY_13700 [Phycisphaerales bacterium]
MQTESKPSAAAKKGDTFACAKCGAKVEVKQPCTCSPPTLRLECCGSPMTKQ